ncbi:unnamed protein product [Dimorphilus gyrociliatus]|uniref:RRM domain-containing protein n=1 Tax=Dimorphilus gyrociliatus TaxID=2664684 RepID=A0A7I8VPI4_9ANNE|nr:unnamed protein product [Dimorphilus gyrociliatus]
MTEPDSDAIKMFVGQIPRTMEESDLRQVLDEFGPIYQLSILRDKQTGSSKGCCFVTYYNRLSALSAQNALHNVRTLPGMAHPIQMKPADSEKRNIEERKLFVGMLSKQLNETDVRDIFQSFGQIEECTILREQSGCSKGCAFVTYSSRSSAAAAIRAMHHSQTMEGCRSPIVVKLADTQKDKDAKRTVQQPNPTAPQASIPGLNLNNVPPQYIQMLQQVLQTTGQQQPQQQSQQVNYLQQVISAASALAANPNLISNLAQLGLLGQVEAHQQNNLNSLIAQMVGSGSEAFTQAYSGVQQYNQQQSPPNCSPQTPVAANGSNRQTEGPNGANLFIYHLPPEFTDNDLLQTFSPFGNLISAKVFIDKATNLSKCFGFVSYDNPVSAHAAIQSMNGFQIGTKRLKVQLKRPKNDAKPY